MMASLDGTRSFKWWYLLLFATVSLFAEGKRQRTFGFTPLEASGIDTYDANVFSQQLRNEIDKAGVYATLEFSDVSIRLAEQNLPPICSDAHCSIVAGQILGVEFFGFGTIGKVGKVYTLSMQVVEVRTGRIVRDISEFFKGNKNAFKIKAIPEFAMKISGIEVEKKSKRR